MNTPDDVKLLERCRMDDLQAMEILVERYQQDVFCLALSILEEPAEAEEATQDALVAALKGLGSYQGQAAFRTWLFAIAINRCRRRLRQRQRREWLSNIVNQLFLDRAAMQSYMEEQLLRSEKVREIQAAVNSLDEKQRLPVILRYYQELPIAEIAQLLGVSERTVHNRLRSAHLRLIEKLDQLER